MARGSAPPQVPSRPLEAAAPATVAADIDPGSMSEPAALTINADRSGAVFIDGEPLATETPVTNTILPAGRHSVQILSDDSQYLSEPRYVVLRNGSTVALFVRNGEAGGTVDVVDERTSPTDGSGALMPDRVVAEDGSAPADEATAEVTDDGSGDSGPETEAIGSGVGGSVISLLLVDRDAPAPIETFRLHVVSEPDGVIFLDGVNTGVRTPTILEIDARPATIQVLQDDGNLSRYFPFDGTAGQGREVFFTGIESFLYR